MVHVVADGPNTGDTTLTQIASGGANAKGSYCQLLSSLSDESKFMGLSAYLDNTTALEFLIDLATGAAGPEVAKVDNVYFRQSTGRQYHFNAYTVPLIVASGSRLAARCQCGTASQPLRVALYCAIP